jgi:hypothetical protein
MWWRWRMEEGGREVEGTASGNGVERAGLGGQCGHRGAASDWVRRKKMWTSRRSERLGERRNKIVFIIFRWTVRRAGRAGPQAQGASIRADERPNSSITVSDKIEDGERIDGREKGKECR